jgi:hypothetical protein
MVTETAARLSALERGCDAALEDSVAQADGDELIEEAEMAARFAAMMQRQ